MARYDGAMGTRALEEVNEAFHAAYDGARSHAELAGPMLVVLSEVLVLVRRGGARREVPLTPPAFHALKAVAHAPVGLFTRLLVPSAYGGDPAAMVEALARAATEVAPSLPDVDAALLDDALERCRGLLARAAEREVAREELLAFARETGPALLRLTAIATRLQLEALHARVTELVAELTADERARLEVVVTGVHQARARSFAMQYFQARLREHEGVEARVTYGEGIATEAEAVALVGTRRLDRAIATAFFGDPRRLQRDVLGDAAAACLAELRLPPLE